MVEWCLLRFGEGRLLVDSRASDSGWPAEVLSAIGQLTRRAGGPDLEALAPATLADALERRRAACLAATPEAYADHLSADPAEVAALVASVDVHHSRLFRDPLTFALLERRLLPALAERQEGGGGSELRVWSAGCAAGQEAYSVAILLAELAEARARPLGFRVFATDRSAPELELARRGVYSEAELANVTTARLRRWFVRRGRGFAAPAALREHLDFSVYELLDERSSAPPASIFGDFDLVLCCNVLIYYRPEVQQRILGKLLRTLAPGGLLITGEAERDILRGRGDLRPHGFEASVFVREG